MQQEKAATPNDASFHNSRSGAASRSEPDSRPPTTSASALTSAGFRIGTWADDILGKPAFTAAAAESTLDLVVASVAELGFRERRHDSPTSTSRAKSFGLELCPAEVGPQLRLQYADQPYGEWLRIAMEPISDSDGNPFIFDVGRDGRGRRLDDGSPASPSASGAATTGSCSSAAISNLGLWPSGL